MALSISRQCCHAHVEQRIKIKYIYSFNHMCYKIWIFCRWCIILQHKDSLKYINHGRNIAKLSQPDRPWFTDVMQLFGLQGLSRSGCTFTNHGLLSTFINIWHSKTSSFHFMISDVYITLDDVASLLHILIRGRFLNYSGLIRYEVLDMIVQYLGAVPGDAE